MAGQQLVDGGDILCVMFNIVVLMSLGYVLNLAGPLRSVEQQSVLGMFMTQLALPALFFSSLSQEDFRDTSMPMLFAVISAKIFMIGLALIFGRAVRESPHVPPGSREMYSGIFALLTTNGDEVGLGVPAMTALFPEMMPILFVLAGIQKMCFLPPALVMLGLSAKLRQADEAHESAARVSVLQILAQVVQHKLQDPLVLSILIGSLYNLFGPASTVGPASAHADRALAPHIYPLSLFGGAWLHPYIQMVCSTLGAAFTPIIFVLSGAASVGIYSALIDTDNLLLPVTLVLLKSVVLPTLIVAMLELFDAPASVKDFAFVFGMFPASGANMVYIVAYSPLHKQLATLMGALALSKIVAFPLILLASRLLFLPDEAATRESHSIGAAVRLAGVLLSCVALVWRVSRPTSSPSHAPLLSLLALELTFGLADGLESTGGLAQLLGWSSDFALLLLALHQLRLLGSSLARRTDDHSHAHSYRLMSDEAAPAYGVATCALHVVLLVAASLLGGSVVQWLSASCELGDADTELLFSHIPAPSAQALVHISFSLAMTGALLSLLYLDGVCDLRATYFARHQVLQRSGLLLVLSAVQQLISAQVHASLPSLPNDGMPTGSLVVMLTIVAILRNGRGIALFALFGLQGIIEASWALV